MRGMTFASRSETLDTLAMLARATPGLELLMLFGSRARGDSRPGSDWDLGYLATKEFDLPSFLGAAVEASGTDRLDLVDLERASGLLRYRAARDGQVLFELRPDLENRFRLEATRFWCDAAYVLRQGYDAVLAELKP